MFPSSVKHRKQLSIPSPPPQLSKEVTSIRQVREQVARKTHFDLEGYFAKTESGPLPGALSERISRLKKPEKRTFEYVPWEPLDSVVLSPRPKKLTTVKRLRNVRTFLPPVIRERLSPRDLLIQDSLQLLRMKKQLESYLLRSPKAAYDYYC